MQMSAHEPVGLECKGCVSTWPACPCPCVRVVGVHVGRACVQLCGVVLSGSVSAGVSGVYTCVAGSVGPMDLCLRVYVCSCECVSV